MNSKPLISIDISTYDRGVEILKKTLFSIITSDIRNYEIILVDQNKNLNIQNLVKNFKRVYPTTKLLYFRTNEVGLSRGRNFSFEKSKGKWVLFFDDDAIFPKNFFRKIEKKLDLENDEPIIFYGNVLNIEDKSHYIKRRIKTPFLSIFNFDTICTINLLFNRKVIEQIGGFDINFGIGSRFGAGEEMDLIIRALEKGYKIEYLKDFIVYHPKANFNLVKKYSYGYGFGALYKKHIFDSGYYFLVLGTKFIGEIIMRVILGMIFLFVNLKKVKLHCVYLKGFIKGFFSYKK